jgi:heptosyltransferase-2
MARAVGAKQNTKKSTSLAYSEKDKKFVDEIFKKNKISKKDLIVGLSVGVGKSAKSRMWPLERFSELADKLIEKKKAKIIFIDSKENKIYATKVKNMMKHKSFDFNGIFTIKHLFYLFKNVDVFITNDSGLMHLATNQGTKTIGLMGPSNPNWWQPYGKNGILIYHGKEVCPYAPCIISNKGIIPECRFGKNNKCMKAITVEEVFKRI